MPDELTHQSQRNRLVAEWNDGGLDVAFESRTYRVERPVDDALMVARRATFDPGKFTERVLYREGEPETLERWQARAVLVALAATEPDDRWRGVRGPHITDYERAELVRLGLDDG